MSQNHSFLGVAQLDALQLLYKDGEEGRLGIEMQEMPEKLRNVQNLIERGFVTIRQGWGGSFWFVLTDRGQFLAKALQEVGIHLDNRAGKAGSI